MNEKAGDARANFYFKIEQDTEMINKTSRLI